LRIGGSTAVSTQAPAAAWPLERVVDLHNELRHAAEGQRAGASPHPTSADTTTAFGQRGARPLAEATEVRSGRGKMLDQEVTTDPSESSHLSEHAYGQRRWRYAAGVLAVVAAALVAVGLERRIETRLNDAVAQVTAAERQAAAATELASRQVVSAREEADRQIAEARQAAQRAETMGAILTAPDVVRFTLTGAPNSERSSAQVLWSRTRGLVLSASRLPAAPPETVYQLWLWTSAEPVSAGLFVPDTTGRATLMTDVPPKITGSVVGAAVTVEPVGGRPTPSGRMVLSRLPLS
jgi:anti-sigma-K factor RskA